jgi:hypothetical protein
MTLQEQRKDLDEASRFLEGKIAEMQHQRQVLINAFNSIDQNQENILEGKSILAQEAQEIMRNLKFIP